MDRLVIEKDGLERYEVQLSERCSIGRDPESDISLNDPRVSRDHARLNRVSGDYFVQDLDSTNGTLVNDQPVDRQLLQHGDRLRIGGYQLQFFSSGKGAEPVASQRSLIPKTARVRYFRGPHKGRSEKIERSLYTIGQPGSQVAAIARRPQGFYLLHIGGNQYPRINSKEIKTTKGIQLHEGDVLEVGENLAEISFV